MKNRMMLVTLFTLIIFAGCTDTMESGLDSAKSSQESTSQANSKPETDAETAKENRPLTFADEAIEDYVRKLIGKEEGDLTASDVESVDALYLGNKEITSISGIEHFTNLRILHLNDTPISDISVLADLMQLEFLDLSRTQIEDITALQD